MGTQNEFALGRVAVIGHWFVNQLPDREVMVQPTAAILARLHLGAKVAGQHCGVGLVRSFYDEIHVQSLAVYIDPSTEVIQTLSIIGVPTTMLIDASGREVWRRLGPETWDAPDMVAMLRGTIAQENPPSK